MQNRLIDNRVQKVRNKQIIISEHLHYVLKKRAVEGHTTIKAYLEELIEQLEKGGDNNGFGNTRGRD